MPKEAEDPGVFEQNIDPVGITADAAFTEVAVRGAIQDAGRAADASPVQMADAVPTELREFLPGLSASEQKALDAALANEARDSPICVGR